MWYDTLEIEVKLREWREKALGQIDRLTTTLYSVEFSKFIHISGLRVSLSRDSGKLFRYMVSGLCGWNARMNE